MKGWKWEGRSAWVAGLEDGRAGRAADAFGRSNGYLMPYLAGYREGVRAYEMEQQPVWSEGRDFNKAA